MCAGAHVYWVDVNTYEHVLRPKDTLRCHSLSVTHLVWGAGPLIGLEITK